MAILIRAMNMAGIDADCFAAWLYGGCRTGVELIGMDAFERTLRSMGAGILDLFDDAENAVEPGWAQFSVLDATYSYSIIANEGIFSLPGSGRKGRFSAFGHPIYSRCGRRAAGS